jgi:DNA-binding transcriptional MerR regulator
LEIKITWRSLGGAHARRNAAESSCSKRVASAFRVLCCLCCTAGATQRRPLPCRPAPPRRSYQQQGDKLLVENLKLADELEAQRLNLKDINEFLTNELKARTAANAALDERVAALSQRLEEAVREREVRSGGCMWRLAITWLACLLGLKHAA